MLDYVQNQKDLLDSSRIKLSKSDNHTYDLEALGIDAGDIVILPHVCENYNQSIEQKQILTTVADYWLEGCNLHIKSSEGDFYGLYKKWFPEASCLNCNIPDQLLFDYLNFKSVRVINLTHRYHSADTYANWIQLNYSNLSTKKIHLYYLACKLMKNWSDSYQFMYTGEDFQLLRGFIKQYIKDDNITVYQTPEKLNLSEPMFFIVDDNTNCDMLKYIFSIKKRGEKETIILFLNNEDRYLFYQPGQTDILESIVPYALLCTKFYKEGEDEMKTEEYILYPYTVDNSLRKSLITTKIDLALKNTGIIRNNDDYENVFLRGMLEATERRTLYLSRLLENRQEQNT